MVASYVPTEGEIARQVLSLVTHHRVEGLVRENEALARENQRLNTQLEERSDYTMDLESSVNDLSVTVSELIQTNGHGGVPRPDIKASHRVCAFCFDFLVLGAHNIFCNCREHVYCSRDCQKLHWGRHHKYTCPARVERYPRRPHSP